MITYPDRAKTTHVKCEPCETGTCMVVLVQVYAFSSAANVTFRKIHL